MSAPTDRKNAAVSIETALYARSKARAQSLGFTTWSSYVVQLIRNDLAKGGGLSVLEEGFAEYKTKPGLGLPPMESSRPAEPVTLESLKRQLDELDELMRKSGARKGNKQ